MSSVVAQAREAVTAIRQSREIIRSSSESWKRIIKADSHDEAKRLGELLQNDATGLAPLFAPKLIRITVAHREVQGWIVEIQIATGTETEFGE